MSGRAVFFYEFNSPDARLAAERIESRLPERPVWTPISYGYVIRHTGVLPWSMKRGREALGARRPARCSPTPAATRTARTGPGSPSVRV